MQFIGSSLTRAWPWGVAVVAWAGLLYALSERNHVAMGPEIPHLDKVVHAAYFTVGSACFYLWLRFWKGAWAAGWVVATLLFAAGVGALDEWHQTFVPGRSGNDVGDWIADLTGGVLGLGLGRWIFGRLAPRQ